MIINKNKKIKNFLSFVFLLTIIIVVPIFVFAQGQFVPNCSPNCGYNDLLQMVNNIIGWVIKISFPIAAGVFAWAGFIYMTTGISDQKSYAKGMMVKVLWGFGAILSAWIIVTAITNKLLSDGSNNGGVNFKTAVPVQGVK